MQTNGVSVARMATRFATRLDRLRVLVIDERDDELALAVDAVRGLGHEPVRARTGLADAAEAIAQAQPDAALIASTRVTEEKLDLLQEIASGATCPVVVLTPASAPDALGRAADKGLCACSAPVAPSRLRSALTLERHRFEDMAWLRDEIEYLEGSLNRRALFERSTGVLMERFSIGRREAIGLLRAEAARGRTLMLDVA